MKAITLLIICVVSIMVLGEEKCWHWCEICGCNYSTPNYCVLSDNACPIIQDNGDSHTREITHGNICTGCRNHQHNFDGLGDIGSTGSGIHVLYNNEFLCHDDGKYEDGVLVESAY